MGDVAVALCPLNDFLNFAVTFDLGFSHRDREDATRNRILE